MYRLFWLLFSLFPLPSVALQLTDGQSFVYDVGKNCVLTEGSLGVYAGMYNLRVNDTNYSGSVSSLSPDGREVRCSAFTDPGSGLEVRRNVYVSKTLNFARFSDILNNPSEKEMTVDVEVFGNLGSGNRTVVAVDQGNFLITNAGGNGESASMPALLHYHSQISHPVAAKHIVNGNQLSWRYAGVTVPAKSQVRLVYFVAQSATVEAATEAATLIFNNPTALYEGVGTVALTQLLNFIPPQPTPANGFDQTPFLNVGERRLGVLEESDALSHGRASTPADAYALNLKTGETVTLRLSASFNAYLYLFGDAQGKTVVAVNDDAGLETTNAEIVFTSPADQTYYMEATAHDRRERGNYTLEVIKDATNQLPRAYNFEFSTEKLVAPTTVTFTDFSLDPDGQIVQRCWQFGDGSLLSCQPGETVTHTFEKAGQYSVGLTVQDNQGAYAYHNEQVSISATSEGVVLPISNTVAGELASSDPRSQTRSSAFADRYLVRSLTPGQELVIDMKSNEFDSYLYLYDEFNRLLAQDDNSGGSGGEESEGKGDRHAQIRYTPVSKGDLLIEATSFKDNTLGKYYLTLETAQNYPAKDIPIEASTSLTNSLQNLFVARLPDSFQSSFLLWDFGDNSPVVGSNEAVVSHLFPSPGRFTVTVTAVDNDSQEAKGQREFIMISQSVAPTTRFRATPLFGERPLRVFFSNESFSTLPGDELSYIWQFGDGEVSTDTQPAHTFVQEGTYQVILQAYSKLHQQSASYSIPISVIDRDSGKIPVTGMSRVRPQVLMAGFDPILLDLLDTDMKIFAIVRPGLSPIQTVRIMQNGSEYTVVMQHVATYANGDQRYETVWTMTKGGLPVSTYPNLLGDKPGQYRIQAIDQTGQFHAFPNLEIGNNTSIETAPVSLNIQPLRQVGTRRKLPQVLASGFDPALVDVGDSQFLVKAIVREGLFPIKSVTLKSNQGDFQLPMHLQEIFPNGDKLYVVSYTYPRDSLEIGTLGSLFGDQPSPVQFTVTVVDQADQTHRFPELRVGNFPPQ
jgi:PKD repeat protein